MSSPYFRLLLPLALFALLLAWYAIANLRAARGDPRRLAVAVAAIAALIATGFWSFQLMSPVLSAARVANVVVPTRAPENSTREAASAAVPVTTVFWGVRLGATRAEVEATRGRASVDGRDVVSYRPAFGAQTSRIEIRYHRAARHSDDAVAAVFYVGDSGAAPPELPYIVGATAGGLAGRFHEPVWTTVPDDDSEFEMFAGGLTAYLWHREVRGYGIQDYYRTGFPGSHAP